MGMTVIAASMIFNIYRKVTAMKYPESFKKEIKSEFPHCKKLNDLAEADSPELGPYLKDMYTGSFCLGAQTILECLNNEDYDVLHKTAKEILHAQRLYVDWLKLMSSENKYAEETSLFGEESESTSPVPLEILKIVRASLGLEEDDTSKDNIINNMSKFELLEHVCNYEGLINYAGVILRWINSIYDINL